MTAISTVPVINEPTLTRSNTSSDQAAGKSADPNAQARKLTAAHGLFQSYLLSQNPKASIANTTESSSTDAGIHPLFVNEQLLNEKLDESRFGLEPAHLYSEDFINFIDSAHLDHTSQDATIEMAEEAAANGDNLPTNLNISDVPLKVKPLPSETKAVLNILQGDLSRINPQDVSALIMTHPLIQEAMSSGDIAKFMQSPQTFEGLENNLKIPINSSEIVQAFGEQTGSGMSDTNIESVVRSLGLDSERMAAELEALQGHLSVGDLSPYIKRAQQQFVPNMDSSVNQENSTLTDSDLSIPQEMTNSETISDAYQDAAQVSAADGAQSFKNKVFTSQTQNPSSLSEDLQKLNIAADSNSQQVVKDGQLKRFTEEAADIPEADNETLFKSERSFEIAKTGNSQLAASSAENQGSFDQSGSGEELSQQSAGDQSSFETRVDQSVADDFSDLMKSSETTAIRTESDPGVNEASKTQSKNETALQELRQQVFEKARFLSSSGGGRMNFDLKTADLGHLELSLQVHDKNLELKITAASDAAREMLAVELPQLRQNLLDQSLELKTVDIGVQQENSFNQSFTGEQGETSQQGFEETRQRDYADQQGNLFKTRSYRSSNITRTQPQYGNSQIQIRV